MPVKWSYSVFNCCIAYGISFRPGKADKNATSIRTGLSRCLRTACVRVCVHVSWKNWDGGWGLGVGWFDVETTVPSWKKGIHLCCSILPVLSHNFCCLHHWEYNLSIGTWNILSLKCRNIMLHHKFWQWTADAALKTDLCDSRTYVLPSLLS